MRVSIHGALHVRNFGDLLLADACANWIKQCVPLAQIDFPWASVAAREELMSHNSANAADVMATVDALVFCGGGYINDSGPIVHRFSRLYRIYGKPLVSIMRSDNVAYLGVGVGPLTSSYAKYINKRFVSRANFVCVRDQESRDWLDKLNVCVENVQITADAAITYARSLDVAYGEVRSSRRILLLHIPVAERILSDAIKVYLEATRGLYAGIKVISDQEGNCSVFDVAELEKLSGAIAREFPYRSFRDVLLQIGDCDDVLTTKYHVGIVAATFGRRVCAVPTNHQKVIRFYKQIGVPENCMNAETASSAEVQQLLEDKLANGNAITIPDEVMRSSLENKVLISKWLLRNQRGVGDIGHGLGRTTE